MKARILLTLSAASLMTCPLHAHPDHDSDSSTRNQSATGTKDRANSDQKASGYKQIKTEDLLNLIKSDSTYIIVDARTKEHDDGKRIPGAKFLPYDSKEEDIRAKLPNKDAMIIVYCVSEQCPVSKYMSERLVELGYTKVFQYPKGVEGWEDSGNAIEVDKAAQEAYRNSQKNTHLNGDRSP